MVTEEDQKHLTDTGEILTKEFACPQGDTTKATKGMQMNHEMRRVALKITVVPGLESTLVSVCNMAEVDYTTVLDEKRSKNL